MIEEKGSQEMNLQTKRFGYTQEEYKKFTKYAWLMLISFGLAYLFFYNGRQNINLVLTQMGDDLGAAVQSALFGFVIEYLGWPAIFVTIGVLYAILLVLTLFARKMKMKDM